MEKRYRVTIIQATIKQYRQSFYLKLWSHLRGLGIDLSVIYSNPGRIERSKSDTVELDARLARKVPRAYFVNDRILAQFPSLSDILRADLVIMDQATGCLHNYPLLVLSRLGLKKVAFWGHGQNRQGNPGSLSEKLKRRLIDWTDWWFAYTKGTAGYLTSLGVSPQKITSIENAIDTHSFQEALASVTDADIAEARRELGIREGDRVGIYCGSLYAEKRVHFLLNAAMRVAAQVPRFRLIVVGGGPEAEPVREASRADGCIISLGPRFGREKAVFFKLAELFLHPGAVGLGILDSFAAGLPFLTTSDALHGPEIDYLEDGKNGVVVSGDEEDFAEAVVNLLGDPDGLASLGQGACHSAGTYTVDRMVSNLSDGILACLGAGTCSAGDRS